MQYAPPILSALAAVIRLRGQAHGTIPQGCRGSRAHAAATISSSVLAVASDSTHTAQMTYLVFERAFAHHGARGVGAVQAVDTVDADDTLSPKAPHAGSRHQSAWCALCGTCMEPASFTNSNLETRLLSPCVHGATGPRTCCLRPIAFCVYGLPPPMMASLKQRQPGYDIAWCGDEH
jgi:hypothetical protein